MASITCGKCKGTHFTSADVKRCYNGTLRNEGQQALPICQPRPEHHSFQAQRAATITQEQPASEKQVTFLRTLLEDREHPFTDIEKVLAGLAASRKAASETITALLAAPKRAGAPKASEKNPYVNEAKRGDVHVVDGTYYRIHVAQQSGRPYAAKATVFAEAEWAADGSLVNPGQVRWDLAKGMIFKLTPDTMATPDQAAAFGKLVGRCCFCSHAIDTPESTQAGYGPVCAAKYGLPWG